MFAKLICCGQKFCCEMEAILYLHHSSIPRMDMALDVPGLVVLGCLKVDFVEEHHFRS